MNNVALLSKQLLEKKDYKAVLQLLLQEQNNFTVLFNSALAYKAIGNIDNSIKCWEKALTLEKDPQVIRELAFIYSQKMQTIERAIILYESLDEDDVAESNDLVLLAECYAKCSKFETAHDCFVHAIDLDPDNVNAYIGAAILQGRWTIKYLKEALKYGELKVESLPQDEPELRFLLLTLSKLGTNKQV